MATKDKSKLTAFEKKNAVFTTYYPSSQAADFAVLKALGKSGKFPAKLERYNVAPAGQIVLCLLGDLEAAVLPTREELMETRDVSTKAVIKAAKTAPADEPVFQSEWLFFPPVLSVEVTGTLLRPLVTFSLGSPKHNIRPSMADLKALEALVAPMFKVGRLSTKGLPPVNFRVKPA